MRIDPVEIIVQVRLGYYDADGHCLKTTVEEPATLGWPHSEQVVAYIAEKQRLRHEQLGLPTSPAPPPGKGKTTKTMITVGEKQDVLEA